MLRIQWWLATADHICRIADLKSDISGKANQQKKDFHTNHGTNHTRQEQRQEQEPAAQGIPTKNPAIRNGGWPAFRSVAYCWVLPRVLVRAQSQGHAGLATSDGRLSAPPDADLAQRPRRLADRPALGGLNYQIEHHLFPSMPRPTCAGPRRWSRRSAPTMACPTRRPACSGPTPRHCATSTPPAGSPGRQRSARRRGGARPA